MSSATPRLASARKAGLFQSGEPFIWITGSGLAAAVRAHATRIDPRTGSQRFAAVAALFDRGTLRWSSMQVATCREARRAGLTIASRFHGEFNIASGAQAASELLAAGPLPEAVIAGSDLNAVGVIARLRESGVRVPEDVLVLDLSLPGRSGSELLREVLALGWYAATGRL